MPVKFTIVHLQESLPGIDLQHGSTRNISEDGLCLEARDLAESTIKYLSKQSVLLELHIGHPSVRAIGEIVWYERSSDQTNDYYVIGIKYCSISNPALASLLKHSPSYRIAHGLSFIFLILLIIGIVVFVIWSFLKYF